MKNFQDSNKISTKHNAFERIVTVELRYTEAEMINFLQRNQKYFVVRETREFLNDDESIDAPEFIIREVNVVYENIEVDTSTHNRDILTLSSENKIIECKVAVEHDYQMKASLLETIFTKEFRQKLLTIL